MIFFVISTLNGKGLFLVDSKCFPPFEGALSINTIPFLQLLTIGRFLTGLTPTPLTEFKIMGDDGKDKLDAEKLADPKPVNNTSYETLYAPKIIAAKEITKLFRFERWAYTTSCLLGLALLFFCAFKLLGSEAAQKDPLIVPSLFGSGGAIGASTAALLYMWSRMMKAIFG